MLNNKSFSQLEYRILWIAIGLLVFGFYFNLGIYPLTLEEPRRALIALEMLLNDNLWVPTQTGELYYRKPPIYNWLLIVSFHLFGEASELSVRFFSVSSHLLTGLCVFGFSRMYLKKEVAILAALGYLVSADILTYFSALGEIDLFYGFITSLSIFLIYYFGEKKSFWWLFLSVYFLTSIGFLTKGLTSLPFTAISLLVYFVATKQWKVLFGFQHISGILLLSGILFVYFYQYSQYADVSGWWTTLWSESTDKATAGGLWAFLVQLFTFPLETLKVLLPASLFIPLLFRKGSGQRIRSNSFIWFCLLIFAFNFPVYWFSTAAKSRYIYPILPFAIIVLSFFAHEYVQKRTMKFIRLIIYPILLVLIAAFIYVPFSGDLVPVENSYFYAVPLLLLMSFLLYLHIKQKIRPYILLIAIMVIVKLTFSSFVPQIRRDTSGAARDKNLAFEIASLTAGEPIARYNNLRISLGIVFYLEREKQMILESTTEFQPGHLLLLPEDLEGKSVAFDLKKSFQYREQEVWLVEVKPQ